MSIFGCRPNVGSWHRRPSTVVTTGDTTASRVSASSRWYAPTLRVTLKQGSTVIAERDVPLTTNWENVTLTLTAPECASITDTSALTVTFVKTGPAGRVDVDYLYMSIEGTPSEGGPRQVADVLHSIVNITTNNVNEVRGVTTKSSNNAVVSIVGNNVNRTSIADVQSLSAVISVSPRPSDVRGWNSVQSNNVSINVTANANIPAPRKVSRDTFVTGVTLVPNSVNPVYGSVSTVAAETVVIVNLFSPSVRNRSTLNVVQRQIDVNANVVSRLAGLVSAATAPSSVNVVTHNVAMVIGRVSRTLNSFEVLLNSNLIDRTSKSYVNSDYRSVAINPNISDVIARIVTTGTTNGLVSVEKLNPTPLPKAVYVQSVVRDVVVNSEMSTLYPGVASTYVNYQDVGVVTNAVTLSVTVLGGTIVGPLRHGSRVSSSYVKYGNNVYGALLQSIAAHGIVQHKDKSTDGPLYSGVYVYGGDLSGGNEVNGISTQGQSVEGTATINYGDEA